MSFQLISTHHNIRRGILRTAHGEIETPFFMPIATKAAVKTLASSDLETLNAEIILSNTYHLYLKPGLDVIYKAGGLHHFMRWDKPILTDSGGYQVFSLAHMCRITDDGVVFQSHYDGSLHTFTPEVSMHIQKVLGSDIAMAFDECTAYPCTREECVSALTHTSSWAQRSKAAFKQKDAQQTNSLQLLFGIIQGSVFEDLRKKSVLDIIHIGFDGYAIGGLAVGEPSSTMYHILDIVCPLLPAEKPRYLMGVGKPENIIEAVKRGVDMFDCVIPSRNARHGLLYIWKNRDLSGWLLEKPQDMFYESIHITNEQFENDMGPIDSHCKCSTCISGYSKSYIRHLFKVGEPLAMRLATIHNIYFYLEMMRNIRTILDA